MKTDRYMVMIRMPGITLLTEVERIGKIEDVRLLRGMCRFALALIVFLLDHFDDPQGKLNQFHREWNDNS